MDVGLCSDRCKLYEEVCPYGNLVGIEFTGGARMEGKIWENLTKTKVKED